MTKYLLQDLDDLLGEVQAEGFSIIGPKVDQDAITLSEISSKADLPVGVVDEQAPGHYRLHTTNKRSAFAHVVGPQSWKPQFFAKEETLFVSETRDDAVIFRSASSESRKLAYLGMRSCDLHAIQIQDKVFLGSDFVDSHYASRRKNKLFIAVNCSRSGEMCFCTSLDTGPFVNAVYDLLLTEVETAEEYYFLLEVGSEAGKAIADKLALQEASQEHLQAYENVKGQASQQQKRLETHKLKENIQSMLNEEAFWLDLADRCLACANCTIVCPSCFCSDTVEQSELNGENSARVRIWDSCFNSAHSHMAGGEHREHRFARYRQWFSHKLSSWHDQFATSGCTGCGRCISWCPVGIDITAEADRVHAAVKAKEAGA